MQWQLWGMEWRKKCRIGEFMQILILKIVNYNLILTFPGLSRTGNVEINGELHCEGRCLSELSQRSALKNKIQKQESASNSTNFHQAGGIRGAKKVLPELLEDKTAAKWKWNFRAPELRRLFRRRLFPRRL